MLLHYRDEQKVKYNTVGAQLHSGHCCRDDVCSVQALSGILSLFNFPSQ